MKPKIALITGITGFVGSWMAELLLEKGQIVYGAKRWRSPMDNVAHIQDKIKFIDWDLTDAHSVSKAIEDIQPDVIYHLAAMSYVPFSFIGPTSTINANVNGTINLLEAVRKGGNNPIIHVCSSSEVYGQVRKSDLPITEECPLRPQSTYGVSKVGEDLAAYQYFCSYGLRTIRTRMFTHTGPRRGDVFVESAFAKQIAMIEARKQKPIIKVGNLDSLRTFADVRDAVKAYWLLTKHCRPGEVYNIGGKRTMTIKQLLDLELSLSNHINPKIVVDKKLLRHSDVTLQVPCIKKFVKATGWEPEIPFETTINDLLNYWRKKWKKYQ